METTRLALSTTKIESSLFQIRGMISKLISDIQCIYFGIGIQHRVQIFETAIQRMLIPVEINYLLDPESARFILGSDKSGIMNNMSKKTIDKKHFNGNQTWNRMHLNQNNLVDEEKLILRLEKKGLPTQSRVKKEAQKSQSILGKKQQNSILQNSQNSLNSSLSQRVVHFQQNEEDISCNNESVKKRSRGLEEPLKTWTVQMDKMGHIITKKMIMEKAQELASQNYRNFKGCVRWCDNFVKRNKQIKSIMEKQKRLKNSLSKNEFNNLINDGRSQNSINFSLNQSKGQQQSQMSQSDQDYNKQSQDSILSNNYNQIFLEEENKQLLDKQEDYQEDLSSEVQQIMKQDNDSLNGFNRIKTDHKKNFINYKIEYLKRETQ